VTPTADLMTEPVALEQLEITETMLEPTVVDAAEIVVISDQPLASDEAVES